MKNSKLIRLAQMSLLAAIAVVLVMLVHFPLIPSMPFLQYDMADVPILMASLLFGPWAGLVILFVVSAIQAFLFGGDGWVGLVMHFVASGALVVCTGLFYRYKHQHKLLWAALGMTLGTIAMALIMIPMNLIFTVHVYGTPQDVVMAMIFPGILPFNLIKGGLNSLLAMLLFKALSPFIRKNKEMIQPQ